MPGAKPFFGQRFGAIPGGVERHPDDAVGCRIGRRRAVRAGQAEAVRDRRADPAGVDTVALDPARRHRILGEGAQHGLAAQAGAQRLHAAAQPPLGVARAPQRCGEPGVILPEVRPAGPLPDIHGLFSAIFAENNRPIRRARRPDSREGCVETAGPGPVGRLSRPGGTRNRPGSATVARAGPVLPFKARS